MFDRQRSSKPQLQRKVASRTREQLEADAVQKQVCHLLQSAGGASCFEQGCVLHRPNCWSFAAR